MKHSLDKLTIKGFKSIKELIDFEIKDINIIVGGNGSGKSNLISFFKMLRALIDGNLNRFIRDSGGASDILFNGRKVTKDMEFEVKFGTSGFRFKLVPTPSNGCALEDEAIFDLHVKKEEWQIYHFHDTSSTATMRNYEIIEVKIIKC